MADVEKFHMRKVTNIASFGKRIGTQFFAIGRVFLAKAGIRL